MYFCPKGCLLSEFDNLIIYLPFLYHAPDMHSMPRVYMYIVFAFSMCVSLFSVKHFSGNTAPRILKFDKNIFGMTRCNVGKRTDLHIIIFI